MNAKKVLRTGGKVVGALLGLAIVAVVVKVYVLSPSLRPAQNLTAPTTPEAIARGKYLANHVTLCMDCHSRQTRTPEGLPTEEGLGEGVELFGGDFPGKVRVPNITPDKETGIGNWTDGEIVRAMREGVSRDGRALFPMMPWMNFALTLNDEDALAIVAYLRTLKPIKHDPGRFEVKFPLSALMRTFPEPLAKQAAPEPPASDKKARGEWLMKAGLCGTCHHTYSERREVLVRYGGGTKWELPDGKGQVVIPNISQDKATGIGTYSDDDIKRILNDGVRKSGEPFVSKGMGLPWEMPWPFYRGLTPEDQEALIVALRAVPPAQHAVEASARKK